MSAIKVMSVVGARPNFMKVAPIIRAIKEHNARQPGAGGIESAAHCRTIQHVLVHTGQHYDQSMSDSFFADLALPEPNAHLGIGSASHAVQTAEVMKKFEEVLLREKPGILIVVGDVNSTLACALVAAKISYDTIGTRPQIVHVEAGLRSFDRSMPEEINRILTDQLSDLLFVTEESGLRNLEREGVSGDKVHFVGNTMIDSLLAYNCKADTSTILEDIGLRKVASTRDSVPQTAKYALLTLHRPANVDCREAFSNILDGLQDLIHECTVVFPAHPRTKRRISDLGLGHYFAESIRTIEPLGYLDFLCLMKNARLVVTDSGGIQEETTGLGVPCVTVRENTERPVTVDIGTNVLAGVCKEGIRSAIKQQLKTPKKGRLPDGWDGASASRILNVIMNNVGRTGEGRWGPLYPAPPATIEQQSRSMAN